MPSPRRVPPANAAPRALSRRTGGRRVRQSGVTLLIVLLLIVLASSALLLNELKNSSGRPTYDAGAAKRTAQALEAARSALLGYALIYAYDQPGQPPGYLPCPDLNGDGSADSPCQATGNSTIGWLPFRTLNIEPLRDGSGACLWYAVSGSYKNLPKQIVTSDSNGLFEIRDGNEAIVAGTAADTRAIAVVMAPGAPLAIPGGTNQSRASPPATRTECGSNSGSADARDPVNYLEAAANVNNATGVRTGASGGEPGATPLPNSQGSVFVRTGIVRDGQGNPTFNDTIMPITPADFAPVYAELNRWVVEKVRGCIAQYAADNTGHYPWAAKLGGSPDYKWDTDERFGRVPLDLEDANTDYGMDETWTDDPDPRIPTTAPFAPVPWPICFSEGQRPVGISWYWWWWADWKEMVFYAVDDSYDPDSAATGTPAMTLDALPAEAVVTVAGRRLAGQARESGGQQGDVANYLESGNLPGTGAGGIPPGDEAFQNGAVTNTFNDAVRCSRTPTTVQSCP